MAPRTKKCDSCGESVAAGTFTGFESYEDSTHYVDKDGNFLFAERGEETFHTDQSLAYSAGLFCKGCNTNASRIWSRDPTYLRDIRDGHAESKN